MRTMRVMSILGLVLGLLAGSAAAQSVQSDFDRTFQFSNLKTFSFAVQRRGATDPLAADSLNDGRIRTGLESQLIAIREGHTEERIKTKPRMNADKRRSAFIRVYPRLK